MENVIKETIIHPGRAVAVGLVFSVALRILGQKKPGNLVLAGIIGIIAAPFIIKMEEKGTIKKL